MSLPALSAAPARAQWQQELIDAVRDPRELLALLALDESPLAAEVATASAFPLRVPHSFIRRMRCGDAHDPLLSQVLPLQEEARLAPDYLADPVGDRPSMQTGGLLHKYRGRVLLLATGACAVHCRYCFRRHFPYGESRTGGFSAALEYIKKHSEISEVILSGGDPLMLDDGPLSSLIEALEAIPHLRRLRLHSRLPIVLPSRITPEFLRCLADTRLRSVLVVHVNHPQELNEEVAGACRALRAAGLHLLNQSVLLAGVNDEVGVLSELSERLFDLGIQPYYLHALDKVQGAQHFNANAALESLMPALRTRLPGYLVPQAVVEEAGRPHKTPLGY